MNPTCNRKKYMLICIRTWKRYFVNVTELDEKIKSIDDLLKDTSDDDFYSLVDSMYKDSEVDEWVH